MIFYDILYDPSHWNGLSRGQRKMWNFFMEAMVLGHAHSNTNEMESMIQSMVGTHKFKYEKSSEKIKNMSIFLKQISSRRIK
jgi:hypothetical protein